MKGLPMKPRLTTLSVTLWLVLMSVTGIAAQAPASQAAIDPQAVLGTNFVYQGFLNNNGQPANGAFDFQFKLYDAPSGGLQVGITSTAANQAVSNGLFTTMINAGAGVFNGNARFLQISVRPAGNGAFVALNPRVELAAVPNAQYSNSTSRLQGRLVSSAAPAPNQVLQWNGSQWVPASVTVTAPLNLTASSGPVLSAFNNGNGTSGSFVNTQAGTIALYGENTNTNNDSTGVYGASMLGVKGFSGVSGAGVIGLQGTNGNFNYFIAGVAGSSHAAGGNGVSGTSDGENATGVYGFANNGPNSFGIWGQSTNGYAGYFSGKVFVNGVVSAANKQFKIDHPLDPANKYLYHTSIESPDMKNIYDGVVTLDANGTAVVELPSYFQALNRDFRYQLTGIGGFAPIYIDKEIENNHFSIAGGKPGMKVSWQVTGIRHDAFAEQHRSPIEEDKPAAERGTYLYPSAYGQPETHGVDYSRNRQADLKQTTAQKGR
jgi:hypothetical protein